MSTKEEQKKHLIDMMNLETLEEASEINCISITHPYCDREKAMFIKGAKWMEQRMYTEEEVLKLLITFSDDRTFLKKDVAIQWFEQFKKQ